jgi:hypothetical protein
VMILSERVITMSGSTRLGADGVGRLVAPPVVEKRVVEGGQETWVEMLICADSVRPCRALRICS